MICSQFRNNREWLSAEVMEIERGDEAVVKLRLYGEIWVQILGLQLVLFQFCLHLERLGLALFLQLLVRFPQLVLFQLCLPLLLARQQLTEFFVARQQLTEFFVARQRQTEFGELDF
jgi:hypothetical protein